MKPEIFHTSKAEIADLISSGGGFNLNETQAEAFQRCLRSTASVWLAKVDGEWVCIWGLILPSLADDRPYLWLHVTEQIKGYEFTFIRQSQIWVQQMLKEFPVIYGHCQVGRTKSIRWVRWLGGVFGEPQGMLIPFQIARTNG